MPPIRTRQRGDCAPGGLHHSFWRTAFDCYLEYLSRLVAVVVKPVIEVDLAAIGRPTWLMDVVRPGVLDDLALVLSVAVGNEETVSVRSPRPDERDALAIR